MSDEYDKVIYEEDSRLLSWLMVRQCAELLGEDAEANLDLMTDEEQEWVRYVGKQGKDEAVFVFVKAHSLDDETAMGTYDMTPESEPKASDWVSPETIKADGTIRQEFLPQWNDMADRPDEAFFLGLAGLRFIERDDWVDNHVTCPNCFVLTPLDDPICTVCDYAFA